MEDFEPSSLEEKVDLGNLVLFPLDSSVYGETKEANLRFKDEPSEIKINDEISENTYIKKETIELPVQEYEKEAIEFSNDDNEMCQICGIEFGNQAVLNIHTSIVHPKEENNNKTEIVKDIAMHKCSVCTYETDKRSHLKEHIEAVHGEKKKYECSICDAGYNERRALKEHMQAIHEGKKFSCSICTDVEYSNRSNL